VQKQNAPPPAIAFAAALPLSLAMPTKAELTRLRALREKKHRAAEGMFVVEGEKVLAELLDGGYPLEEIYFTPGWTRRAETGPSLKMVPITPGEMERISHFPTPSPVLAVGRIVRQMLPAGAINRGLTLALDGIQDAGNVGTLLRIADWFGCDRVLLSPDCADLFSQKVIDASMGSFARVQTHSGSLVEALAGVTVPVLGCDLKGEDAHEVSPMTDAVLVIGSEGRGLSPEVRELVMAFVTIPRHGRAESLNAAAAAAVVLDNLRRAQAATKRHA
jgi:TrmH family RNA methyltransferase